jgi:hypothetical protein
LISLVHRHLLPLPFGERLPPYGLGKAVPEQVVGAVFVVAPEEVRLVGEAVSDAGCPEAFRQGLPMRLPLLRVALIGAIVDGNGDAFRAVAAGLLDCPR